MADAVIGRGYLQVVPKMDKGKLDTELSKAGESGSSTFARTFQGGMSAKTVAIGNIMSSAILKGVEKASQAATEVFAGAFTNFATFEQLTGGVEKIFNDMDTSRVFADANNAWRELNMSANDYMATINDVGAMFSATMGDEAAYEAARKGMQAISDYSSGTGKNLDVLSQKFAMISRATSSYQSIADQFSGILPATSADFLEQAQAAGLLSEEYTKLTEVPIDEYQQALVSMLEKGTKELGLHGNTAEETAKTISGSIAGMQSAWSNFLTGIADDDADMGKLTDDLVEAIGNVVDNALPRIQEIAGKIGPALVSAISGAIGSISPEWAGIFDRVSDGADKVAAGFGSIIEHAEATGVLDDFATAIYNVADAVSSADFTEFFEMISNCFKGLTDFYGELKQIESDKIVDAGGALPEILDPDTWNMALDSSGAFRKGLEDLGVTTREYGRVSASTQRQVAQEFARNGGDIVAALASAGLEVDKTTGKIEKMNSVKLEEKRARVNLEDGQLLDAQGHVYTWNGTELLTREGDVVVDQVELIDAQGNIVTWNGTKLERKRTSVSVDTSSIDSAKSKWDLWKPATKIIDVVVSKLGIGDAAGGFYQLHAAGDFITNGPINLGRDSNGVYHIAGEAGREWVQTHADGTTSIVPLENQRYLEPYARTIAGMIGSSGAVYNLYIDGMRVNDDAQIQAAVMDLFGTMRRKAVMLNG